MSQSRNNKSEDYAGISILDRVFGELEPGAVEDRSQEPRAAKVLPLNQSRSYKELEERVVALKSELSEAESQTLQQEREKQALEHRHSALLEVLPAGVVVLDARGN